MGIYVHNLLENGLTKDITNGTVAVVDKTVHFRAGGGGELRRTRWFKANAGETIKASVQVANGELRLYGLDDALTETLLAKVVSDSVTDLKVYSLSYTVPPNTTNAMFGISYYVANKGAIFYNPKIEIEHMTVPPRLIACGLLNLQTQQFNASFPNVGFANVTFGANRLICTLTQKFKDGTVRPLVVATDANAFASPNKYKLVCSDVAVSVAGVCTFNVYYVNTEDGTIVAPPTNSFASITVYY